MLILNERSRTTSGAMCHELLASVAKAIAGKMYDSFASDNEFYKLWPDVKEYIALEWGRFVPEARRALAMRLGAKDASNEEKEQIYEALALDRSLPKGRIDGVTNRLRKLKRMRQRGGVLIH